MQPQVLIPPPGQSPVQPQPPIPAWDGAPRSPSLLSPPGIEPIRDSMPLLSPPGAQGAPSAFSIDRTASASAFLAHARHTPSVPPSLLCASLRGAARRRLASMEALPVTALYGGILALVYAYISLYIGLTRAKSMVTPAAMRPFCDSFHDGVALGPD